MMPCAADGTGATFTATIRRAQCWYGCTRTRDTLCHDASRTLAPPTNQKKKKYTQRTWTAPARSVCKMRFSFLFHCVSVSFYSKGDKASGHEGWIYHAAAHRPMLASREAIEEQEHAGAHASATVGSASAAFLAMGMVMVVAVAVVVVVAPVMFAALASIAVSAPVVIVVLFTAVAMVVVAVAAAAAAAARAATAEAGHARAFAPATALVVLGRDHQAVARHRRAVGTDPHQQRLDGAASWRARQQRRHTPGARQQRRHAPGARQQRRHAPGARQQRRHAPGARQQRRHAPDRPLERKERGRRI